MSGRTRDPGDGLAYERSRTARNGLDRERIADIQRARLLAAMSQVACERGVANVTAAHVIERAGVSRRTFYEIFTGREDCFLAAFEEAIVCASGYVLPAYDTAGSWRERMRTSLVELLRFFDEEPALGCVLVVESLSGGTEALARRSRVLERIVTAVDEGRLDAKAASEVTLLTAEGVVGAIFAVIHARLSKGAGEPLVGIANQLMGMIVLPYLGSSVSRQELSRRVLADSTEGGVRARANPLRELPIRLTYRTVRVLMFVAAKPGSSNREIGVASGILDQGQVSKLLARLQRLGLVQNEKLSPRRGAPNAWTLTATGLELAQAMSISTSERSL